MPRYFILGLVTAIIFLATPSVSSADPAEDMDPADQEIDNEPTVVSGGLDKRIIQKVIKMHTDEVRYCYERELVKNPKLTGKIVVKFTIELNGSVSAATVESNELTDEVGSCLVEAVKTWVFPERKGGGKVVVRYPFIFKSAAPNTQDETIPKVDPNATLESVVTPSDAIDSGPAAGKLAPAVIKRVIRRHRKEVKKCYAKELRKDPKLAGEVKVSFMIGEDGSVKVAKIKENTLNKTVGNCIVAAVERWTFPAPDGGPAMVVYPFVFKGQ